MRKKLIRSFICASVTLGASALQAQDKLAVPIATTGFVETTIDECMVSLEKGTPLPVTSPEKDGHPTRFVVYNGSFFFFVFHQKRIYCEKIPAKVP